MSLNHIELNGLVPEIRESLREKSYFLGIVEDLDLLKLSNTLGKIVTPRFTDPLVQELTPQKKCDARALSLSKHFGLDTIPFHTDCAHHIKPPRLILLYSPLDDKTETATSILVVRSKYVLFDLALCKPRIFFTGRKHFYSPIAL